MFLTDTVTNVFTVDGFTIRNGNTEPGASSGDLRRGGGILAYGAPSVRNCYFTQNYGYFGGGLYPRGAIDDIIIEDCVFENNRGQFGGGVYNLSNPATVTNCTFNGNLVDGRGGGLYTGTNCSVSNCTFTNNLAPSSSGGALQLRSGSAPDDVPIIVDITDCLFTGDNEPLSTAPLPLLNIQNTYFLNNTAIEQGGGINISNGILNLSNSLFDTNFATDADGIGGAISLNTSDSINTTFTSTNNTIVNNIANTGAGISNWKQAIDHSTILTLKNNIFYNPLGDDYIIELGDPMVVSAGGNLCQDASLDTYLTGTNDLLSTDPEFVDFSNEDYHLQNGSPCIDMGILGGAPLLDLEGNPRVDEVDIGVFENQKIVSTRDIRFLFGKLTIYPNPIQDDLNFTFESLLNGELEISVSNIEGKIIFRDKIEKTDKEVSRVYDVTKMPKGVYNLTISNGEKMNTQQVIK